MRGCMVLVALAVGCTDPAPSDDPVVTSHVEEHSWGPRPPQQLDVLFVIDDSSATAGHADRIAELADVVDRVLGDSLFSIRIAVTSNDGRLRPAPSSTPVLDLPLEYDLTRETNFHGTLADNLRAMFDVGTASAASSRLFDAQREALEHDVHGFLRPNAHLLIVTVSAQDDASTVDPHEHAAWLEAWKPEPAGVAVAGIYAMPAPRLDAFHAAVPYRSVTVSLDDPDHSEAIELASSFYKSTLALPCANASDVDPVAPGAQFDCTFTATIRDTERVLPPCRTETDSFCWEMLENPSCTTGLEPRVRPYNYNLFTPAIRSQCVVLH